MRNLRPVLFALLVVSLTSTVQGATESTKFVPFGQFIQSVSDVNSTEFVARPMAKVTRASSVEEMRRNILSPYQGVQVGHS